MINQDTKWEQKECLFIWCARHGGNQQEYPHHNSHPLTFTKHHITRWFTPHLPLESIQIETSSDAMLTSLGMEWKNLKKWSLYLTAYQSWEWLKTFVYKCMLLGCLSNQSIAYSSQDQRETPHTKVRYAGHPLLVITKVRTLLIVMATSSPSMMPKFLWKSRGDQNQFLVIHASSVLKSIRQWSHKVSYGQVKN